MFRVLRDTRTFIADPRLGVVHLSSNLSEGLRSVPLVFLLLLRLSPSTDPFLHTSVTALEGHSDMTIFTEYALRVTLKVLERLLDRIGGAAICM
jgi:hypothetical protein